MRLLLIRHGETAMNATKRFQGQYDEPLNERGREQAASVAKRLAAEKIDAIFSSDLSRANETARNIAALHELPVQTDQRLREMDFGEWEGMTYSEIKQRDPKGVKAWEADLVNGVVPGGEGLDQLAQRVRAFVEEIYPTHQTKTVLLVAHGGTLQMLLCQYLGLPLDKYWQFRLKNASVTDLSLYPEGTIVNLLNGASHLA